MSGHKKLLLNANREYERWLRDDELRQRVNPVNLPEIVHEINRRSQPILDEIRTNSQPRPARSVNQEQSDLLPSILYQHELDNAAVMLQQQMATLLEENIGDLSNELNEQFQLQLLQFQAAAAEMERHYSDRLDGLSSQLDGMYTEILENKNHAAEMATSLLETLTHRMQELANDYPENWVKSQDIALLERKRFLASENMEQGLFEAAIAATQQAILDGEQINLNLQAIQASWSFYSQKIWEFVWLLNEQIAANAIVNAMDENGQDLGQSVDVDFWTAGGLAQLQSELQSLYESCQTEDVSHLKNAYEKILPTLSEKLKDQVCLARIAILDSQTRINIADLTAQALQVQGFGVEKSSYRDDDPRNAYQVEMGHLDGSKILISINPVDSLPGQTEIHLISQDAAIRSEHELVRRASEIQKSLSNRGLDVLSIKTVPTQPTQISLNPPHRKIRAIDNLRIQN